MKLILTDDKRIKDIQTAFSNFFPYLRLQFFRFHTNPEEPLRVLNPDSKIEDVTYLLREGSIYLTENITVRELEKTFNDRFGLNVHVLRKAGNKWLETMMTKTWSLQLQNDTASTALPG